MNIIFNNLELKTFTEQDVLDYCFLNNINPDKIEILDLRNNKLTDISGVKLFKNLRELYLWENKLTDISVIQYLTKLKFLYLNINNITDISVLKDLIKLETLCVNNNNIKDISIIKNLTKLKTLSINNLELKSDQIQYIKSLKNLKTLWCRKGFKNMSVLNTLNNNIYLMK